LRRFGGGLEDSSAARTGRILDGFSRGRCHRFSRGGGCVCAVFGGRRSSNNFAHPVTSNGWDAKREAEKCSGKRRTSLLTWR
jgi:hypothetical protein